MSESTPPSELFSERLKSARELRDLSQSELANRAGLQASAISHFETRARKPSFDNLKRLADALDVTTDFLLGRVDDPHTLGAGDTLHRHIDQLSTDDKEFVEDMLERLAARAKSRRKTEG